MADEHTTPPRSVKHKGTGWRVLSRQFSVASRQLSVRKQVSIQVLRRTANGERFPGTVYLLAGNLLDPTAIVGINHDSRLFFRSKPT
jgi:hypothetical protein